MKFSLSIVTLFALAGVVLMAVMIVSGYKRLTGKASRQKKLNTAEAAQPRFLFVFMICFLLCVVYSTYFFSGRFLSLSAAWPAEDIVSLFLTTTVITGVAFFITQALLFYFAWRYRQATRARASFITGSGSVELVWTLVPAGAFIFLFLWGHVLWTKIITSPKEGALEIEVMAQQFNWMVRYAGADQKMGQASFRFISESNEMGIDTSDPRSADDFIPVQMHVPKNKPVLLILRSKDVIHSFFIPLFGTKMDAVPGMKTSVHFTAKESTAEMRLKRNDPGFEYEVACAELCGRMHFAMKLILVVDEPEQFETWYRAQQTWANRQAENKIENQ